MFSLDSAESRADKNRLVKEREKLVFGKLEFSINKVDSLTKSEVNKMEATDNVALKDTLLSM